ncbi:MAG TPA: hypothetical protein VL359_02910, partial [bacterium]|nr:hypothetical protein [bacterium]
MEPENTPRPGYQAYRPRSFDDEARDVTPLEDQPPGADFLPTVNPDEAESEEPGQAFRPGQGAERSAGAGAPERDVDFASIKFQREATLLTNAEDYAASIRREAELYVSQIR